MNVSHSMAGALLVSVASVSLAQQTPPPPPPPPPTQPSANEGTRDIRHPNEKTFANEYDTKILLDKNRVADSAGTAAEAASCIVKAAKDKAGQLIGGPLTDDPKFEKLSKALGGKYRNCNPGAKPGVPLFLINSAIASELMRTDGRQLPDRATGLKAEEVKAFYSVGPDRTIDTVGRCLAAYSPGLTYRVVQSAVGSAQEKAALQRLYAQTPECGVAAVPADIPMVEQRSALSTGLYAWTHRGG